MTVPTDRVFLIYLPTRACTVTSRHMTSWYHVTPWRHTASHRNVIISVTMAGSSWTLVTVTAERVLLIYLPTHARTVTSLKLARIVMTTQWLILTALELHTFWSLGKRYTIQPGGTKQLFSACSIATSEFTPIIKRNAKRFPQALLYLQVKVTWPGLYGSQRGSQKKSWRGSKTLVHFQKV